jgi:hypothetical protein
MKTHITHVLAVVAALALAAAVAVSTASAGLSRTSGASCSGQATSKPFLPWLDPFDYVQVGNGALESTGDWKLSGGAKLVSGNESFKVHSSQDRYSLSLPSGSSATSPPLCITLLHPDLRFFVMNSGNPLAVLKVEAITTVLGIQTTTPVAFVVAGGAWQPTLPFPFLTNVLSPVVGSVSFRFTPVGLGSGFRIDDVYVDPYKSG